MKRILLLSTGGTIASKEGGRGLAPALKSKDVLKYLDSLIAEYSFDSEDLMDLDSSNIQPEEWQLIAKTVWEKLPNYDGIIITHGTDTMSYTASALSLMLQGIDKSVVLTGSQLPIDNPLSDAPINLFTAIAAIENDIKGVSLAFNRKIISGTRAVKTSTMGFDAFESVNAEYLGEIFADGVRINQISESHSKKELEPRLRDEICTDIFLLKLIPGTKPELFDAILDMGYKGVVIEAFGSGGLHNMKRNLIDKLSMLIENGVTVVICSQCLYERCDLSIYEVGQRILETGVISGDDMTTEAIVTRLMWSIGQTENIEDAKNLFLSS